MNAYKSNETTIETIDSHTAGEPTRITTGGYPVVKGNTIVDRMVHLKTEMGWLRKALMQEPRGHRDMFGCILLPHVDPTADTGVIFIDGGRYYNKCGHASLGVSAMLVETGRVTSKLGNNIVRLETPAGIVEGHVELDDDGNMTEVSVIDVP